MIGLAGSDDKFSVVGFIQEYESGNMAQYDIVAGFQHLIDSGIVWKLQGSYGRTAVRLIEGGHCRECEGK